MSYSDNSTQFDEFNAHREAELSVNFSAFEQMNLLTESHKALYDIEHIVILSDN